jgi:retinol dehydrogenase-12
MQPEPSALTPQGYDMQWGTNVLGPFFFTELIMPALNRSRQATGEPARIVNTSSYLHVETVKTTSGVDPNTYVGGQARDATMQKMGDKALKSVATV